MCLKEVTRRAMAGSWCLHRRRRAFGRPTRLWGPLGVLSPCCGKLPFSQTELKSALSKQRGNLILARGRQSNRLGQPTLLPCSPNYFPSLFQPPRLCQYEAGARDGVGAARPRICGSAGVGGLLGGQFERPRLTTLRLPTVFDVPPGAPISTRPRLPPFLPDFQPSHLSLLQDACLRP